METARHCSSQRNAGERSRGDSGVTTEGEAVAPTAVSNGQVDVQDQVSSFVQHGQELQDADGTRGQHASEPIIEGSVTRRKRKQGGLEDSRKRTRLDADLEDVEEDLSSQDGEVMSEKGPEQDMDTDQLHARSDRDSPHDDANPSLARADTETSDESIEVCRGGSAHADLPDRMSDTEGDDLEPFVNPNYLPEGSPSSLFQLSHGQPHQSPASIGVMTPLSKTSTLLNREDQTPAETERIEQTDKARQTGIPSVDGVFAVGSGRNTATDASTTNASTETQQRILDQLAPLAYLDDTKMEKFLLFWLLPESHHSKISTPPLWACLWRVLFIVLARKSPITTGEKTSLLTSTTAAPVTVEGLSPCQQLVRQHEQASATVKISKSKRASLDHAKRFLTDISAVFQSLVNAIAATTSHLACNQQFLEDLLARDCADDRNLIEELEKANTRIKADLHSRRGYEAKGSDLAFLLEQVDVLAVECTQLQTASAKEATVLVSTMKSEQAILLGLLQQYGATDSL